MRCVPWLAVICVTAVLQALVGLGCSSESSAPNRTNVPSSDGGTDADAAMPQADPNGGRDDNRASCYATCQNSAFTCQTKGNAAAISATVELTPDAKGCSGTLTPGSAMSTGTSVLVAIDCSQVQICRGDAPGQPATVCVSGTFSAMSFAYQPSANAALEVCTRD